MAADNVRAFPWSRFAQKTEAKSRDGMRVPHMGDGVRALYRYYRHANSYWPAHEALLLARYHEGMPEPRERETSSRVRRLYRGYRQATHWSAQDALRVARCHAQDQG